MPRGRLSASSPGPYASYGPDRMATTISSTSSQHGHAAFIPNASSAFTTPVSPYRNNSAQIAPSGVPQVMTNSLGCSKIYLRAVPTIKLILILASVASTSNYSWSFCQTKSTSKPRSKPFKGISVNEQHRNKIIHIKTVRLSVTASVYWCW